MKNVLKKWAFALSVLSISAALTACSVSSSEQDVNSAVTENADVIIKTKTTDNKTTTVNETETNGTAETILEIVEPAADDFEFEESDGEITIKKYKGDSKSVRIPAEIDGKPVTVIGSYSFEYSKIRKLIIPEGVTAIKRGAFKDCKKLEDIVFPESIISIEFPFDGVPSPWLKNKREENPFVIVNNILIDGANCFGEVNIPEEVTIIGAYAFSSNTKITSIKLPDNLTAIESCAFMNCTSLTDIVIPDSVKKIGSYAFDGCKVLENVTFPNHEIEMGNEIFGLICYYTEIEAYEGGIPWLASKVKENPLVIVNGNLISGSCCDGKIVIPDSVASIALGAFYNGSEPIDAQAHVNDVTLPNGITKIPDELFSFCHDLTNVTIPDSVTEIGDRVFVCCESLENITLPNGLKKIGSNVFDESALTGLTLPDSVEEIEEDTFERLKIDITYKGEVYSPTRYKELYAVINDQ